MPFPLNMPSDPFSLLTSKKHRQLAKHLQDSGAKGEKAALILQRFYSVNFIISTIVKRSSNPEWLSEKAWRAKAAKRYEKAIAALETLATDEDIPAGTRKIIAADLGALKKRKDHLTLAYMLRTAMRPTPVSVHQMIGFQAYALHEYIRKFGSVPNGELYDFIAAMLRNLYRGSWINAEALDGKTLKKNYIDNVLKLRGKYDEHEKIFKSLSL